MPDYRTPLQRRSDALRASTVGHTVDSALVLIFFAAFLALLVAALLGVI